MSHSRSSRRWPPRAAARANSPFLASPPAARLPKRRLWFLVATSVALVAWLLFLLAMVLY